MAEKSAPPSAESPKKRKKGGCRRCLKWFFMTILVLLILGAILAAIFFRVPERLGLVGRGGKAEKLLITTSDRETAAQILKEAAGAGLNTKGVSLSVLPLKSGEASIAFAILSSVDGFTFPRIEQKDPIIQTLIMLGTAPSIRANNITVVGFEFYDDKGRSYMTVAAQVDEIEKVARGQLTKEEFMQRSYGNIRIDEIFSADMDQMKEFLSESKAQ